MLNEELYDLDAMENEVDAEQYIGEEILAAGHAPFLPLANSVGMEDSDIFTGAEFVAADLTIIRSLDPSKAAMVMRPGWSNGSEGAAAEYETACELGWVVVDMESEDLQGWLQMLRDKCGPMTIYVSGKYRHLKEKLLKPEIDTNPDE